MFKNLFKIIDFIPPKITLFYEGDRRYSTTTGGIFSIIIIFVGFYTFTNQLISYLNYDINYIQHYRNYIDNLGYEFNNDINSFFIFVNFLDFSLKNTDIDLNKIRLIATFRSFINVNELSFFENDHWLFADCDSMNLEPELIKFSEDDLSKAVCIKYYYNSNEKHYYSINDENFKKPKIEKSSDILSIFAHKCINNSITNQIYGNCSSEREIINYITNKIYSIKLSFLAHQINTKNAKNPDQLYINSINSKIQMKNTYISNSLTFSPLIIEKDARMMFGNMVTEKFHTFQDSMKSTEENLKTKDILNLFCIMFENVSHSYKIYYKTIYDLLTKVIILMETIYYILFFINYIFNLLTANIIIQNIIFHKKFAHNQKMIQLFSENYKFNIGNKSFENIKNPLVNNNINMFRNSNRNEFSLNKLISNKSSILPLNENSNSRIEQLNKIGSRKTDARKINVKHIEDKIFGNMIFTKNDILLFFKYLICDKWNNSPLLLFDSMQKKILSVEHLFQLHLLLFYLKKNNKESSLMDIYKFFYE